MAGNEKPKGSYAPVNGLDIYHEVYEVYSEGQEDKPPLVTLPGAFMTIEAMGGLIRS